MKQSFVRQKTGKTFHYLDNGRTVTDLAVIKRIKMLAVPPAWQKVQIAKSSRAKVQAVGIDKAGRKQAIYHASFRKRQEEAKFARILSFGSALPKMRKQLEIDMSVPSLAKQKVLACIVTLMDYAYFRIGNDIYAKTNKTYGITTLRSKHTKVKGADVTFHFIGKSGKEHIKTISDKRIARIVQKLDDLPGYEIFKYYDEANVLTRVRSGDVNEYIKHHMGSEYTAKDFRTWGGTLLAAAELAALKRDDTERARKKAITTCIKNVARQLGNTPAVTRSSYIDPRILSSFLDGDGLRQMKNTVEKMRPKKYLSRDEQYVLALLQNL